MKRTLLILSLLLLISYSAQAQWVTNGNPISLEVGEYPQTAPDGAGGAIITWETAGDIYAQRVDGNGIPQWTLGGLAICVASGIQTDPVIVADGLGGAIIAWEDYRNGAGLGRDIYAQRVDANGGSPISAPVDGVAICTANESQRFPRLAPDGTGGAIIAWDDDRNGESQIYARRMTVLGSALWAANGVLASSGTSGEVNTLPDILEDGSGGAIIAWTHTPAVSGLTHIRLTRREGAWLPAGPLEESSGTEARRRIRTDRS